MSFLQNKDQQKLIEGAESLSLTTISQSNGNDTILKTISISPHQAASELKPYMFNIDSTLGFVNENQ